MNWRQCPKGEVACKLNILQSIRLAFLDVAVASNVMRNQRQKASLLVDTVSYEHINQRETATKVQPRKLLITEGRILVLTTAPWKL